MSDPQIRKLIREIRGIDKRVSALSSSSRLINASIENGSVEEYDLDGNLVGRIGRQHDGTHAAASLFGPVPPTPTAPTVSGEHNALTITWDGTFEDDKRVPMDFQTVQVGTTSVPGGVPTLAGVITSEAGGAKTLSVTVGTHWVALRSRSQSGRVSPWSALVEVEVEPIGVDPEIIDDLNNRLDVLNDSLDDLDETILPELRGRMDDAFTEIEGVGDRADQAAADASAAAAAAQAAQSTAEDAEQAALDAAGIAEGKGQVITQTSAPTGSRARAENLWVRLPDHKVHVYDGDQWVAATDPDLIAAAGEAATARQEAQAAQSAAEAAQDAADALEGQVSELQADLSAAEAAIATVRDTTIPALNADLTTLRDDTIPALEGIVGPLPDQVQAAQAAADAAQAEAEMKASTEWVLSRGTDLVTNGTGYMRDNTNFPDAIYDASDTPSGITGSFRPPDNVTSFYADEFIPYDPTKTYLASVMVKNRLPGNSTFYLNIKSFDVTGFAFSRQHYRYRSGSETVLTEDLNDGDTVVHVEDASGWDDAVPLQSQCVQAWNYVDPTGKKWEPFTYTRNVSFRGFTLDVSAGTITLNSEWNSGHVPAGTAVSQGIGGDGANNYIVRNEQMPHTWTRFSGLVRPEDIPPGTATVQLGFLTNRGNYSPETDMQAFAAASFSDATAAMAEAEAAQARADAAHDRAEALETSVGSLQSDLADAEGAIDTLRDETLPGLNTRLDDVEYDQRNFSAEWITAGTLDTDRLNANAVAAAVGEFIEINADQITAGLIQGSQVEAESVASAVGSFLELNAGQITAGQIGAARINTSELAAEMATVIELDAERITTGELGASRINTSELATEIATIIELDAGRIRSGTINTNRLDAQQIGAAVGEFLDLRADQITAIGAGFREVVANQMFADIFAANKVTASEIDVDDLAANQAFIDELSAGIITAENFEGKSFTGVTFQGSTFSTDNDLGAGIYIGPDISNDAVVNGMIKFGDPGDMYSPHIDYHLRGSGSSRAGTLMLKGPGDNVSFFGAALAMDARGVTTFDPSPDGTLFLGSSSGATMIYGGRGTARSPYYPLYLRSSTITMGRGDQYSAEDRVLQFDLSSASTGPNSDTWITSGPGALMLDAPNHARLPNPPTTTSATNARIHSNGLIYRISSLRADKVSINAVDPKRLEGVLDLEPVTWFDKVNAEAYSRYLHEGGHDDYTLGDIVPLKRVGGLVAEDVHDAGLKEYLLYDTDGQIEGIAYDRLWTLLIPVVRDLRNRVMELEGRDDGGSAEERLERDG